MPKTYLNFLLKYLTFCRVLNCFLSIIFWEGSMELYLWKIRFQFCFEMVFQDYVKLNKTCILGLGNMKEKRKIMRANILEKRWGKKHCYQDLSALWISVLGLYSNKAINSQTRLGHKTKANYKSGKGRSSEHIGLIRMGKYKKKGDRRKLFEYIIHIHRIA